MEVQIFELLKKLIVKNNIRLHQEELKLQLLSHPSYPSLHSLTGVLSHFGINNLALRLPVNEEILDQLPPCFMANITKEHQDNLVLVEKEKDKIKLTYDRKKTVLVKPEEFLQQWNGIIVAIEKDENVIEVKENALATIVNWALPFLMFLLVGAFFYFYTDWFSRSHFLLSIAGFILSVFIVKHELGLQSTQANDFCNLSEKTSCDAVLNSKGATLFGLFKLSDLSIVTFAAYCLFWLLVFANGTANATAIVVTTLLAIPAAIYSLYYQYWVVKKWCPLCLGIVAVLLLQASTLLLTDFFWPLDLKNTLLLLLSGLVTIGVWGFLKPLLAKKVALEKLEVEHFKFKRNFSLFNVLHSQSNSLSTTTSIDGEIVLGNQNAPLEMIMVTNPFCHFCKQAHWDIDHLLRNSKEQLKVIIRFNLKVSDREEKTYKVVTQLLHIYSTKGKEACQHALMEVYGKNANPKKWIENQHTSWNASYEHILEEQYQWCATNEINFTPALYFDGKQYPEEYDRKDIVHFIDDILELHESEKTKGNEQLVAT